MPKSVQSVNEPEYGAKVGQERNEDAQGYANAVGASMYPEYFAEGDEEQSQSGTPATQTGNVAQGAQQPMGGQQGYTVRNPAMLIPASMNYPNRAKTMVERNYDAGLLWQVLAGDSKADPLTRIIANALMGKE
jgi:hypothetical protein